MNRLTNKWKNLVLLYLNGGIKKNVFLGLGERYANKSNKSGAKQEKKFLMLTKKSTEKGGEA